MEKPAGSGRKVLGAEGPASQLGMDDLLQLELDRLNEQNNIRNIRDTILDRATLSEKTFGCLLAINFFFI